jgi:hypothetical protein
MRVIFLDFDGVFNTSRTPQRWNEAGHLIMNDPDKVFMFNRLIDWHPEIKVVLSSSWRFHEDWRDQMRSNGLLVDFLDRTTLDEGHGVSYRGAEVDEWLSRHPEVERYAIIDDANAFREHQQPNFFRTYWNEGLTQDLVDAVEKHLV